MDVSNAWRMAGGRVGMGNNNQNVRNSTSALIVGNATAAVKQPVLAQKAQAAPHGSVLLFSQFCILNQEE